MNKDHALGIALGGSPSAIVMLAQLLRHFEGVDSVTAGNEAGLILLVLGAVAGFAHMMLARRGSVTPAPEPSVKNSP